MKNWFNRVNIDFIGMSASALCAIHCLALPFILAFMASGTLSVVNHEVFEAIFILISISLVVFSLSRSFKKHKNITPFIIAFAGILMLFIAQLEFTNEHILNAIGGLLIASAHYVNYKAVKVCVTA